ncbi:hypothetical protein [Roseibium alexandrii]|uniref:DUF1127 domain-containing protein n=1 Tax=Roseibium alexandrii (strain DSM 17067 / NCIMB 14079 / DFL-11) TaxID=244592 RepID=A0A5E8UXC7_ROSAD|nr:hypothetical protein [Roseibium alexandrii]RMX61884.1 hypothetical protein SADFL11_00048460 [Roseibium alexandrii DFL-11]
MKTHKLTFKRASPPQTALVISYPNQNHCLKRFSHKFRLTSWLHDKTTKIKQFLQLASERQHLLREEPDSVLADLGLTRAQLRSRKFLKAELTRVDDTRPNAEIVQFEMPAKRLGFRRNQSSS